MSAYLCLSPDNVSLSVWDELSIPYGEKLSQPQPFRVAVQWGAVGCLSGKMPVFNPLHAALRSQRSGEVHRLLSLNGIRGPLDYRKRVENGDFLTVRRYVIPVFNLQPLAILRKDGAVSKGNFRENAGVDRTPLSKGHGRADRVVQAAIKALYCLGLDFGSVTLEEIGQNEIYVLSVNPFPNPKGAFGRLFVRAINRYALRLQEESETSIDGVQYGADPEFLFRGPKGKIVPASRCFPANGTTGWDRMSVKNKTRPWQSFHPLAEIRPEPGKNSRELFAHLAVVLNKAFASVSDPRLHWIAGPMPYGRFPLGGHLHVSGVWLNVHLLRALDNYLALPFRLIEPDSAKLRRPRFGSLGDFRRKAHGGFEYRTLSSWLAEPKAAIGVFSLLEVIVKHYWHLTSRPLDFEKVQRQYYEGDKEGLLPVVQKLWGELERLDTYQNYERDIHPFKEMAFQMKSLDESKDFKTAWKNCSF